jgi:hypothetical protein
MMMASELALEVGDKVDPMNPSLKKTDLSTRNLKQVEEVEVGRMYVIRYSQYFYNHVVN